MTQRDEFFSFEEALDRLRLKEEELKRLVSEGEIRAFRDGETMKLRRADVEDLRRELMGGDVVDLDDASDDELVLSDPGMATEELSTADTLLGDEIEELDEVEELDELEELDEDEDDDGEEGDESAASRRRQAVPEEPVNPLALAGIFFTTIILILIFPVLKNHNGQTSAIAKSISGLFVGEDEAEGGATPASTEGTEQPAGDSNPFPGETDGGTDAGSGE